MFDREHNCDCGLNIDRDYNSALNILKKATVGRTESNALGEPFYEKASGKNKTYSDSMNQEPLNPFEKSVN